MKKIFNIALCLAMMAGAISVSAQAGGEKQKKDSEQRQAQQRTPEEMAKQRADRMKDQLSLDDAQYEKILALETERAEKMNQSRPNGDQAQLTDEQKAQLREKMKEAREAHDAQLKEILTEEQFSKYQEMGQNGPRERRPAGERQQKGDK